MHTHYYTPRFKDPMNEDYLELSYEELEELNLALREKVEKGEDVSQEVMQWLSSQEAERIKAVTVLFTDLEGKLHALDYDKKFILGSSDNLTFDGSSISGFSTLDKSDLRLTVDWNSFRYAPADVFGPGKVLVFANISDQDGKPYEADFRSRLSMETEKLKKEKGLKVNLAPEIEGFLLEGMNAEKHFDESVGLKPASEGGYYNSLPQDVLREFIDGVAEAIRALGFKNEKDHPEVAPGQFEINYRFRDVLHAADQIQLYKIVARQIAAHMGYTASFLPKPIAGINGSGMHSNLSLEKNGKNIFFEAKGQDRLSAEAHHFIAGVLHRGEEMCLILNSSVNAYRRLDPNFEAPNEIKVSASDRGSMVRIPLGNEKSARMEVRSVAPDANPYLAYTVILAAGLEGMNAQGELKTKLASLLNPQRKTKKLAGTIQDALAIFKGSKFIAAVMGERNKKKFAELKEDVANRSPKDLGTKVKRWEVLDHHEVRNQVLSSDF